MQNLIENCLKGLTKDNITLTIAIAGFIISLINFAYFFIVRKRKITINFGAYGIRNYHDKQLLLIRYRLDNNSQLPISITRMQILFNRKKYDCDNREHVAEEYSYKKAGQLVYESTVTTDILPVNLSSLASHTGFLGFVIPPDTIPENEKSLTFRICTNRGGAIRKTFLLCKDVRVH